MELNAATLRDGFRFLQQLQSPDCRGRDVDWIRAAQRLGQNVTNAGRLDNGANRPARDNSGPG
jgi:hypothetical protein